MTRKQIMTASVITHVAKRQYSHKRWLDRQSDYQKIKDQDCYGYKRREVSYGRKRAD